MRMRSAVSLAALAAVVVACSDRTPITSSNAPPSGPQFAISDGAHNGNPNFFFLPPLVTNPNQSANVRAGSFNPHLLPVVRVFLVPSTATGCALTDGLVYGPVLLALDGSAEQYQVNWDTKASSLDAGANYRICVFGSPAHGAEMLGYADVSPVAGGMKKVATNDVYGFQDDRTLPIKVRIQNGALSTGCTNPASCSETTVIGAATGSAGDTTVNFVLPSGLAALSIPPGAIGTGDTVTFVIKKQAPPYSDGTECLPTDLLQAKGCYHFSTEPALYQFLVNVRMEACVDAQGLDPEALRLFKYNTTQGLVQLPWATPTLIDCANFVALGNPAASSRASFAAAALRRLGRWAGRLFGPQLLYASRFATPPAGIGGGGGSLSDFGGAIPGTATQAQVLLTVPASGTVGQTGLVATASGGSGTGAFSYASSTPAVCTVNAETGSITLLTAGTCTITATKAADEVYKAATSAPGSFPVAGLPDLVVSSLNLQTTEVNPGGQITYTYTISNIGGEGPTGNSTFDVAAYLSSDPVLDAGDLELGGGYSVWQYHLTVGWSHSLTVSNVVIPNTIQPGSYYLIVVADAKPGLPPNYYPGVTEANESNNWRAVPIAVAAPSAVLVDCPVLQGGGDQLDRGFYVQSFPGTVVDSVEVAFYATAASTQPIRLGMFEGAYLGPVIGVDTLDVTVPGTSVPTKAMFQFFPLNRGYPLSGTGKLVAFAFSRGSPDATTWFYDVGPCDFTSGCVPPAGVAACNVVETEGTSPPLDVFRRNGVYVRVFGH